MTMKRLESYLRRSAEARPEHLALEMGGHSYSYAALDATADRVGRVLQEIGVAPGDRVALVAQKQLTTLAAILGVLRAGAIYVPLDPASPAPRLQRMLDASGARVVLTGPGSGTALTSLLRVGSLQNPPQIGWLGSDLPPEEGAQALPRVAFTAADLASAPTQLKHTPRGGGVAHLLFTSGSTGQPKGVMVTHESVIAFVDWAVSAFGLTHSDRLSGHPPLHFDLSTFDMFGTYAVGATLFPVPTELNLIPARLAGFIREQALTQWFSVPSVYALLAKHALVQPGDFPSLRRLLWCGEVLPTGVLKHWMERVPHAVCTNLYGPTEATIASSFHTVHEVPTDVRVPVPIGRACGGESLLVLDDQHARTPVGEIGHLYIAGAGLSPGYWNDEEKTAAAFITPVAGPAMGERIYRTGDLAREDRAGVLHFVGRADTQVKSRGYRIELGEIETALDTLPMLRESAVVAIDSTGFEGAVLCGAVVGVVGMDSSAAAVRTALAALLPSYMLPTRWMVLEALPRNANGKIDRPALRERFATDAASAPPPPSAR